MSRAELREALPGCDGSVKAAGANGQLAVDDLCTLWDGQTKMRADAAVSLAEMNEAYVARFGADMCLSSGYRTLAEQRAVKAAKGALAAPPGSATTAGAWRSTSAGPRPTAPAGPGSTRTPPSTGGRTRTGRSPAAAGRTSAGTGSTSRASRRTASTTAEISA
ncbi:hypothetical protein [Cellulomonas soli]